MGRTAFVNDEFLPLSDAKVGITTHAFNYGTNVFEGIRAYWNEDVGQLFLFRPVEHYTRLHLSARFYGMELKYSAADLSGITVRLLAADEIREDVYIRPLIFKATDLIGLWRPGLQDGFAIFHVPMGKYISDDGIRCCVSTWRRPDGSMAPARAKIGGVYALMALARREAISHGFDEALMLTGNGTVGEGTGENVFLVQGGTLVTPCSGGDLLPGITRSSIIELVRNELGRTVVERTVNRSELYASDEVFLCGTAAEVTPVVNIDHHVIGNGDVGPVTAAIRSLYADVVRGRVSEYLDWCVPVYLNEGPP